jgi:hypothetical protein
MSKTATILQLRIELQDVQPLIWRRIQIPGDSTFWDLHIALQSAFGWNDSHLHEFRLPVDRLRSRRFGIPFESDFGEATPLPGWEHPVAEYLSHELPRLEYCYDFGDDWCHDVIYEDRVGAAPGKRYPRCLAGERAGPPDDCGGAPGYAHLLEVLSDPSDEEHDSSHAWAADKKGLRGRFDPEAFDEQQVKFARPGPRLKRLLAGLRSGV